LNSLCSSDENNFLRSVYIILKFIIWFR
jgi:hypothetical protein